MLSILYGLQKHFANMLKVDIVNSPEFNGANNEPNAMLVNLKHDGKAVVDYKNPLSAEDLKTNFMNILI